MKKWQELLSVRAKACDPLASWYDLVSFIAVEQKKRLKGKPLLAQSLYAMEEMLRLFYQDLTNEKLPAPDEGWGWDKHEFYGKGVVENKLLFLEFVTNRFHLNPRPKLVLIVEGDGEEQQFPRLAAEGFGIPFSRLGIEVYNLKGVDNAADDHLDKYGALKKLIDYHHDHQTLVFAILDDEGSAKRVRDEVTRARSRHNPKRTVMPKEHFHLWNDSIEFDNFSYDEIARAMTQLSEDQYTFTVEEIRRCHEAKKAKERDPLKRLFDEKVYAHFSKVKLLKILFDFVLSSPAKKVDEKGEPRREVGRLMKKIIDLAASNYQPTRRKAWEINQSSGYLGDISK